MADSDSAQKTNEELQQRVDELEGELQAKQKKNAHAWAIIISVVLFILMLTFPIEVIFIFPKFKTMFAVMLGPGEGLPELTEFVLKISDAFTNNAIITIPAYLIFSLGCAGLVGFQCFFLPRPVWIAITVIFFLLGAGCLIIGPAYAMYLPFIKMTDKLGY